jgi:hypothetical protein
VATTGAITLAGTVNNAGLTNSTISGVALGSNLANLSIPTGVLQGTATTYNGSTAVSISSRPPLLQSSQVAGVVISAGGTYAFQFLGVGVNGMATIPSASSSVTLPQTGYYTVSCRTVVGFNALAPVGTGSLSINILINGAVPSTGDNVGWVQPVNNYGAYPSTSYFNISTDAIVYVASLSGGANILTATITSQNSQPTYVFGNYATIFKISD